MRLYDNPWLAIAYFLGAGAKGVKNKLQNTIDKRDKQMNLESTINYLSASEEEQKRRCEVAEKREKRAFRCLLIAMLYPIFFFVLIAVLPEKSLDFPPPLALIVVLIIISPWIFSIVYGLWYSLYGKYL